MQEKEKKNNYKYYIQIIVFIIPLFYSCKSKENKTYIYDRVKLLSNKEVKTLDSLINDFDNNTTSEFFIYTTDKIPDSSNPEKYSIELMKKLGVGKPGINNGVLVFVSTERKNVQFRLGYGFEWVIDQDSSLAIVKKLTEYFSHAKYFDGIIFVFNKVKELSKSVNWEMCKNNYELFCISKIKIKDVLSNNGKILSVIGDNNKNLNIYYTTFMNSLVQKILNQKGKNINVYCKLFKEGNAYLLGVE
jgi:hypothetical protein